MGSTQERLRIGEEIEMWIEGVIVLPLARHHNDEFFSCNAPEFSYCQPVIQQVLNDMSTDHRIKFTVNEG